MNRTRFVLALTATTVVVVAAAAFLGFTALRAGDDVPTSQTDALVQTSSAGGVDVAATLATPGRLRSMDPAKAGLVDLGSEMAIVLTVETHQGDLRSFDYAAGARLLDGANAEEKPLRWIVAKDDSHHLEGMLVFARQPRSETTLALRGLGGMAERVFTFPGQQ